MAKAKKLPSGNWRIQAAKTIEGKKIRKSFTAQTKQEVQFLASEWTLTINEESNASSSLTLEDAIDKYCEINSNVLSPSTIVGYKNIKNKSIEDIAECRLDKISSNTIQKWVNDLSKSKSPKTVKNCYGLISAVFRQFCPNNAPSNIKLPQLKKPQNKALNEQEIKILLNSIEGNEIEVPILLALWLGLRKSEILALEWSDIKNHTIKIDKALVRNENGEYVIKPPKTIESERILNLPQFIEDKLKLLNHTSERIFPQLERCLNTRFFRLMQQLNLKCKFHDLRRTMATLGVKLNISDKIMMARGGWSNPQTMKLIYEMALAEDMETADERINEYILNLIKTEKSSHESSHENKKAM